MTNNTPDGILYLRREDVEMACKDVDSVAAIREVFLLHGTGQTILPDEAYLGWENQLGEQVRNLNMPGYVGGSLKVAGTKIINGNIANTSRGLPRASGITLIYDDISARIVCIMEGAYISSLRTASVSMLAVETLQGREIQSVGVIGAGVLARAHIELMIKRLPHLQLLQVFDADRSRVHALQGELTSLLEGHHIEFRVSTTAEEAIRPAQLIIPATTTTTGYIPFAWLQPGSILVNVSLDDPLPDVVFQADKIVVDDWNLVKNDPRRLLGRMYRQGQLLGPDDLGEAIPGERRRVDAQLGEIVAGTKAGRQNLDEIMLVNPFGLAIEDVALASRVYQTARQLGYGLWLER